MSFHWLRDATVEAMNTLGVLGLSVSCVAKLDCDQDTAGVFLVLCVFLP